MGIKANIRPLFNNIFLYKGFFSSFNDILFGNCRVLGFHSILPSNPYPSWHPNSSIVFNSSEFEILLKRISVNSSFISLDELVESNFKKSGFCLTFDDGYLDNLEFVLPILKRLKIPAAIFVNSSFANGDYWNWWDNLGFLIMKENILIDNGVLKGSYKINNIKSKISFFNLIKSHLIKLDKKSQSDFFKHNNLFYLKSESPFMSWDDLQVMGNEPLITLGSHTDSHLSLKYCDKEMASEAISNCIELMKIKLKISNINHFALPYGHSTFSNNTLLEIKNELSLSTIITTNPFNLKDFLVSRLLFSNI
jgi:peptidoglycan/xylan/chitin deacetylase (PgdA/CDA1 family)